MTQEDGSSACVCSYVIVCAFLFVCLFVCFSVFLCVCVYVIVCVYDVSCDDACHNCFIFALSLMVLCLAFSPRSKHRVFP